MFGAGHIMDMIQRLKQAQNQRQAPRPRFKSDLRPSVHDSPLKPKKRKWKQMEGEEFEKFKGELESEALREKEFRIRFLTSFLVVLTLVLFVYILWTKTF